MEQQGLIHIYCGNGKGKTTAAVGLAVRACGAKIPVLMAQFLKDGTSSELRILQKLPGFSILPPQKNVKFTFQMNEEEHKETAAYCTQTMKNAFSRARQEHFGLLILDETFGAVSAGLLDEALLIEQLKNRPKMLEVIMTGRGPSPMMLELADYVTEMQKKKHPYEKGVPARRGIEY